MFRRIQHTLILTAAACFAQEAVAPVRLLVNTGAPMKVDFNCDDEYLAAAGMSCTDESPCPIYLELSGVSSLGKKIAVAGNLHGSSSTLYSLLLLSDDAGANWKEPAARVQGAALDQVQVLDSTHIWAAGESQVPLARDPFFLISTDGGGSWRKSMLTDETSVGAVQRFWFDTFEHGELIVDGGRTAEGGRYALYESKTGGDSWNISSKTAQPPRLQRAPAADDGEYRIGNDTKARSFVIERRSGNRWLRVAAFVIQAASCGTRHLPPAPPADAILAEPAPDGK